MKKTSFLLIVVSMLFAMGCSKSPNVNVPQTVTDPHVRYESPKVQRWLKLDFINYLKRDDGLIEFEARFVNISTKNKNVIYKIHWRDGNGFAQKSLMSRWIFTRVEPNRGLVVHGISPNMKSSDFVISLQDPRRVDKHRQDSYHRRYSN